MTPLIAIQILGVVYKARIRKLDTVQSLTLEEIIDMQADVPCYEVNDETGEIQVIPAITDVVVDDEIIDFD